MAYAIYYFFNFSGSIPNNQNDKYAELTESLQGLFRDSRDDGLLIKQPRVNSMSIYRHHGQKLDVYILAIL
ncbi:hypothetical protein ALT721_1090044 [Alteromonas alvinellae]